MNVEEQILSKSSELFIRYGLKSLTMDDIARELGVSKKTIYQYSENKADLIQKCMQFHIAREVCDLDLVENKAANAIDETFLMIEYIMNHIRGVNSSTIFEMQKYFPKAFAVFNEYKENYVRNKIQKNIERGVQEGYYRDDLNSDIISKIYISAIVFLFDQQLFPAKKYQFVDLYQEFINYHLHGILSAKGLKYIAKKNEKK